MAASFWIRSVSGVTVPALVSVFESVVLEVVWQQVFAPACMFVPVALEKLWQLPSVQMLVFCPSLVCISSASGLGSQPEGPGRHTSCPWSLLTREYA